MLHSIFEEVQDRHPAPMGSCSSILLPFEDCIQGEQEDLCRAPTMKLCLSVQPQLQCRSDFESIQNVLFLPLVSMCVPLRQAKYMVALGEIEHAFGARSTHHSFLQLE